MDGGGALEPEEPPVSQLTILLSNSVGISYGWRSCPGARGASSLPPNFLIIYLCTCVGLLMDGGGALEPEEPPVSHLSNIAYHLHIIR